MLRTLLSFLWLAVLLACGEKSDEPMTEVVDGFASELSALETAVGAHETTVHGATDLAAIQTEEANFKTSALGKCNSIGEHMVEMGHCELSGNAPNTEEAETDLVAVEAELDLHATNMAAVSMAMDAHDEETRFATAMDALIATMHEHHVDFAAQAADYMCSHPTENEHDHD